jgi:hypothetical protein
VDRHLSSSFPSSQASAFVAPERFVTRACSARDQLDLREPGSPPVEAVASGALAATQGETHEPQDEENDRGDPQQMDRKAQSKEQQYQKQCQQEQHGFVLSCDDLSGVGPRTPMSCP